MFPQGFALVPSKNGRYKTQKVFFERFKTSHKVTCGTPISAAYYSMKGSQAICYKCGSALSERPGILEMIKAHKELCGTVLPTCLSQGCGKFSTGRPKRPKRPAPGARPASAAKRRREKEMAAPE